jgi:peroxiredoxin
MTDREEWQESQYNYPHFHRGLMIEQFEGGPKPGEMAPDFTASTLGGEKVRLSDFHGQRHVVLQFGSVT